MITWGYIAGFLDGDGWITKTLSKRGRPTYLAGLTQNETCKQFMVEIHKFLVYNKINAKILLRNKYNCKSKLKMVNITVKEQKSLVKFLTKIKPFLLIKKDVCNEALQYLKDRICVRKLTAKCSVDKRKWTTSEYEILKKLVEKNCSNIEISHELNRGTQAVANKISRLELRKNVDWTLLQFPANHSVEGDLGTIPIS
jgi:hypothetical protein